MNSVNERQHDPGKKVHFDDATFYKQADGRWTDSPEGQIDLAFENSSELMRGMVLSGFEEHEAYQLVYNHEWPVDRGVIPFEQEYPESGEAVAEFCRRRPLKGQAHLYLLEGVYPALIRSRFGMTTIRAFRAKRDGTRLPYRSRNDVCFCGSGLKYKKCCSKFE